MGQLTTGSNEEESLKKDGGSVGYVEELGGLTDDDDVLIREENDISDPSFYLNEDFLPVEFCQLTRELTHDIIQYVCNHDNPSPATNRTMRILRNLVDDSLRNRLNFMSQLVDKLDVASLDDLCVLDRLVTEMFDDELVTWSRLITLFTFCSYLARHCEDKLHLPGSAQALTDRLTSIFISRLGLWITANGGWGALDAQFPTICIFDTGTLWKVGGYLALLCGGLFAFYTSLQYLNSS